MHYLEIVFKQFSWDLSVIFAVELQVPKFELFILVNLNIQQPILPHKIMKHERIQWLQTEFKEFYFYKISGHSNLTFFLHYSYIFISFAND